jgi:carbamoyl-phosphate synthase large subunit
MITGIGGGGVGEQILKALKLSDLDYYLVGGDMNRNSKGLKNVDKPYILPPASSEAYVDTLLMLCKKHDIKALFYGSEPELKVMSKYRKVFSDHGIFIPLNPENVINICMDKNMTMEWFQKNEFTMPRNIKINRESNIDEIDFYPVVLKPSVGGGGSNNTFIARDKNELSMFSVYLLSIYNEFIAQEYVGTPESEYTVGILNDMQGNYINSIAVKKNIMSGLSNKIKVKNTSGNTKCGDMLMISSGVSQGEIGKFPEVTAECKKIAQTLGCTGPINIQCRLQDNKVYVFEINPRISGTTSLRALVGYNEPDVMIRKHILGQNIEIDFSYKSGYIARGLDEVFIESAFMDSIEVAKI